VFGAITAPQEGEYGDQDMLDQLLEGRDPQAVFSKDGLFDELKKALAEPGSERRVGRSSGGRSGGGPCEPSQRLLEEDGPDREREDRRAHSARSGRNVRSEADPALSAALSWLRRQDRVDVRAWHERAGDPGPPGRTLRNRCLSRSDLDGHRCCPGNGLRMADDLLPENWAVQS
jgi:hypothetical protein